MKRPKMPPQLAIKSVRLNSSERISGVNSEDWKNARNVMSIVLSLMRRSWKLLLKLIIKKSGIKIFTILTT